MTLTDEEWFAERDRLERAKGRCPVALFLGLLAVVATLFSAAGTVWSAAMSSFGDNPDDGINGGLLLCAASGVLGLYAARMAARAYAAPSWARWLCGFPGGVAAAGAAAFVVGIVLTA